jgi:hypothetical protein
MGPAPWGHRGGRACWMGSAMGRQGRPPPPTARARGRTDHGGGGVGHQLELEQIHGCCKSPHAQSCTSRRENDSSQIQGFEFEKGAGILVSLGVKIDLEYNRI